MQLQSGDPVESAHAWEGQNTRYVHLGRVGTSYSRSEREGCAQAIDTDIGARDRPIDLEQQLPGISTSEIQTTRIVRSKVSLWNLRHGGIRDLNRRLRFLQHHDHQAIFHKPIQRLDCDIRLYPQCMDGGRSQGVWNSAKQSWRSCSEARPCERQLIARF